MQAHGAHPELWSLAQSPAVGLDVGRLADLPCSLLWQAEVMAHRHREGELEEARRREVAEAARDVLRGGA